jgi:hypothetical protein
MSISTIFPPLTGEAPDGEGLSTAGRDEASGAVDERRAHEEAELRVAERLAGHRLCAPDLPRCACRHGTAIGAEHDIGVEHRDECV